MALPKKIKINSVMQSFRDNLTQLVPYAAGEQLDGDDVIKLNSNENPYPPSPEAGKVLKDFGYEDLRKYPALTESPLDTAISEHYKVGRENVLSGNSSDEVLAMCFRAFFNSDKPVLFPDITYSFYSVWCDFYGISYEEIPVSPSFEINEKDYIKRDAGGIIIPNPNAPTGIAMDCHTVEKLVKCNSSCVVIIDEAYADFGDSSCVGLIEKFDNLLITRTMSKSRSLAGLRVGYAIGNEELIRALKTAMDSFNAYPLSRVSVKVAEASMRDRGFFLKTTEKIKETRRKTSEALLSMGFELTDSKANFLFMTHKELNAKNLYEYLLGKKILVRYFGKERINNYLRVSIGKDEDMKVFLHEVGQYARAQNVI